MGTPNHYNNSAPYRQSPTPTYQTHIQQTPTRQTHNIMQHAPTPQQQPHVGGASMQQQQHNTFNQQNNQQVQVHHRSSIEFAAQKVYAIDPNSVASFYEACQNNPGLLPIDVAIHFAPDPTPTFCGEKLHSLNMTYGYYNSPNCWKYDVSSEYRNPTLNFRLNTKRQSLTYAEVYHDGEKLKSFLKLYDEKIWFVAANGEDKYDLRKLFDPSGGVTIQYTNNGQTYTIGWKSVPQEAGGDLFAHRANILKYCEKEGKPLLPPQSQVQLPPQPSYQFPPVVNPPFSQVPPPATAAAVPEVPLSPVPPQVSPMRASTEAPTDSNIDVAALATANAKCNQSQNKIIDGLLASQGQQSKDMGRLEFNMNELVGAVTTGFNTMNLKHAQLEYNQERDQEYNNKVHGHFDSRIKALELENARRNAGGALSSPAPPLNASATASAVDEEMDDSSSPAPAPVPQVSAPPPVPSTDQEMADSSPSKKMPSDAGAAAAPPQTSAATSNEAASSPFTSVSEDKVEAAVTTPKKMASSSHIKTTTPTKPTFNFGSPSTTSNEAASSPFAPNVASSSVPVDACPKKISASCSSGAKTTTPTEATFNIGFSPRPKEKPNPKNKIKGKKNTIRRSPKTTKRSSSTLSPKKKTNVMRNNLVSEKRKKKAAPSPVKNPASDISKSVTPKASNSAPVAPRYGTELVNGAVRDWNDEINHTNNFCAEELIAVAFSAFKYDNVSHYCEDLTSGLPNNYQKVVVLFQNVVDTDSYEKLVDEYITGLKTFRCGTEDKFEEEIKKGIDIAKLKGGMK